MSAMKSNGTTRKVTLFSQVKYEHMVAGISGGVTSTLILHPLDLIKIRFAAYLLYNVNSAPTYSNYSHFRNNIRKTV
ncbi:hypothetical protein HA402_016081 [Bradysia odoriphaga]|nr:hypothetical protein HA402_016081 [Bradysia odoriphaga]